MSRLRIRKTKVNGNEYYQAGNWDGSTFKMVEHLGTAEYITELVRKDKAEKSLVRYPSEVMDLLQDEDIDATALKKALEQAKKEVSTTKT